MLRQILEDGSRHKNGDDHNRERPPGTIHEACQDALVPPCERRSVRRSRRRHSRCSGRHGQEGKAEAGDQCDHDRDGKMTEQSCCEMAEVKGRYKHDGCCYRRGNDGPPHFCRAIHGPDLSFTLTLRTSIQDDHGGIYQHAHDERHTGERNEIQIEAQRVKDGKGGQQGEGDDEQQDDQGAYSPDEESENQPGHHSAHGSGEGQAFERLEQFGRFID